MHVVTGMGILITINVAVQSVLFIYMLLEFFLAERGGGQKKKKKEREGGGGGIVLRRSIESI